MKKTVIILAAAVLACAPCSNGQTVNIHKTDGTVLNIPAAEFDYIDFTTASPFMPCPDVNHPHQLDLGLPSGTKWSCCNVGAESPEVPGAFYAWGETEEKEMYNWDSYIYYDAPTGYTFIGNDISGTEYDPASVHWGEPWQMPSATQIQELLDNCTAEGVTVGDVEVLKLTSANGTSIYLPIGGTRWANTFENDGVFGYIWSGSYDPDWDGGAYGMCYGTWGGYWDGGGRLYGRNIRPVVKAD